VMKRHSSPTAQNARFCVPVANTVSAYPQAPADKRRAHEVAEAFYRRGSRLARPGPRSRDLERPAARDVERDPHVTSPCSAAFNGG
jgi:hypothetical protein